MSEYKGIKGFQVQTRTEDPVPYAQALADNPYAGAWSSGGSLNTARYSLTGMGTLTDALVAGGNNGSAEVAVVENYNGTSWTEVSDLNLARRELASAGTDTASVAFGGIAPPIPAGGAVNESWDGSSWTEVADLNEARYQLGGFGTSTAALGFGGANPGLSPSTRASTESWNGSSWTEVSDLNQTRSFMGSLGIQTAGLAVAGDTNNPFPNRVSNVEQWNGSSWTEVSDVNTTRAAGAASGTTTDGLYFGGQTPAPARVGNTEAWNGSAWTEVNDMATARDAVAGEGTGSVAFVAGGYTTTAVANTEEWTFSGLDPSSTPAADYSNAIIGDFYYNSTTGQFKTVNTGGAPIGAFSSGGDLNTSRNSASSAGTQTAMIAMGGEPDRTDSEQYDGSSWTSTPSTNDPHYSGTGFGTYTSALIAGGFNSPTTSNNVELWDGSSWSTTTDMTNRRYTASGSPQGPQSAGIVFGGVKDWPTSSGSATVLVEEWNGSSWTEVGDLNNTRAYSSGAGNAEASPPPPVPENKALVPAPNV
jgi:hypothetical protein